MAVTSTAMTISLRYAGSLGQTRSSTALNSSVRRSSRLRPELWNIARQSAPSSRCVPSAGGVPSALRARAVADCNAGWVVIASDVTHYYENMESGRPFTAAFHIGDMLEAYDALRAHAASPHHIIPGHDRWS